MANTYASLEALSGVFSPPQETYIQQSSSRALLDALITPINNGIHS